MQEIQVQSQGLKDTLEKQMVSYSSIHSCLENSMDRRAWWATVQRVAESDTTEQLTLSLFFTLKLSYSGQDFCVFCYHLTVWKHYKSRIISNETI